jgi:hypothetical protein
MHPCGITADKGSVASLSGLTGRRWDMDEALPDIRRAVADVLELDWV